MIETERVILDRWREADVKPYAAMMADPEVAYWLGGVEEQHNAAAAIARFDAVLAKFGYGYWALRRRSDEAFIGMAELSRLPDNNPLAPGYEIGWRLARSFWGNGYVTEVARVLIPFSFERLRLPDVFAFTAVSNTRSRAVMERIGMRRDERRDFDHPALPKDHPLLRHVVYVASAP